ncbi:MAG: TOBE domain-containing protein [Desulfovibrionaceae bacterium]
MMSEKMPPMEQLGPHRLRALRDRIDAALASHETLCREGDPLDKRWSRACRLFTVKDGVRHLDGAQLESLESAFEAWVEVSRDARTRRSRERVCIVFLVLRYTGARLGEVLALDERRDIDYRRGVLHIPDASGVREIPLPGKAIERIRRHCAAFDPEPGASGAHREPLFDLDQGFIRRKFYEQQERTGLPKELLNPRVLRTSRAIELQRGGMPLRAVQAMLGHTKADFTAAYVALADNDLKHIIRHHLLKEFNVATSVRNTFHGVVARVRATPVASEVTMRTPSGYELTGIITTDSCGKLGLAEGRQVTALVKATWADVRRAPEPLPPPARNTFSGVVTTVAEDGAMVEVTGLLQDGTPVCALLAADHQGVRELVKGDVFLFGFAPLSVIFS